MCGIFGLIVPNKNAVSTRTIQTCIQTLFDLSESRGKEASGIAISNGANMQVLKMAVRGKQFIKTAECNELIRRLEKIPQCDFPLAIIGHTRLATDGKQTKNSNNQPVIGRTSLIIHNGIIVNTRQLWKKYPTLQRKLDVDTEIILSLYEYYLKNQLSREAALYRVYKELKGAATIAILERTYPYLILGTNTGSLYTLKKGSLFLFTSEKYILEELGRRIPELSYGEDDITHCLSGSGLTISLADLAIHRFNLFRAIGHKHISRAVRFSRPISEIAASSVFTIAPNLYRNMVSKLSSHVPDYRTIHAIRRCTRCIMPETMPMIQFDEHGVCNFCRTYTKHAPLGLAALQRHVSPFQTRGSEPNCIVALSGGRDSAYGLHYIKNVLKLNPIAYTYDWGMITDVARRNQSRLTAALGVEHIVISADINKKLENIRKNVEAWLAKPDLGMVTLLMAGDKQAEYYAEQLKRKTGIKLVIYCRGNQIEDERFKFGYYGIFDGTPGGVIHNLSSRGKLIMLAYYAKQFLLNPNYINTSLLDTAWAYASAYLMSHDFVYLWHYIGWNERHIVSTIRQKYGWEVPEDAVSTWRIDDGTPSFYNYIYYQLQGFTEHDGLRSNQIREGVMSRTDALTLVNEENKPRYEALKWYFDRIGMDGDKALTRIDHLPTLY